MSIYDSQLLLKQKNSFIKNLICDMIQCVRSFYQQSCRNFQDRDSFITISRASLCHHLNNKYFSVFNNDDNEFAIYKNHSPICILHLKYRIMLFCMREMNFNSLNWKNIDTFTKSFQQNIHCIETKCDPQINETLLHLCNAPDQKDCDPDIDLFTFALAYDPVHDKPAVWYCCALRCPRIATIECVKCKHNHYCCTAHQIADLQRHERTCLN